MLFIGHTRFSLFNPQSSSWRATNGRFRTPEDYEAYLYADARLDVRYRIFIQHSLPQLEKAALGHDLRHVVSYSANLPAKYRALLEDAADRFKFLVLDEQGPDRQPVDLHNLARDSVTGVPGDSAFGMYRLDDDDLLTADFFCQVAPFVRAENAGMQVSLASGYTALYEDGVFRNARSTYWPMLAIGLLSVCRINEDGSIVAPVHAPHHLSDRSNPVIVDARKPAYLWTRHVDQDTAMDFTPAEARVKVLAQMGRYPAAESVDVDALFPAISDCFSMPTEDSMLESESPLKGPMSFPINPAQGTFSIAVDASYGEGVVPGNTLVSLDLRDSSGARLDPDATPIEGIGASANPSAGYYRYLDTPPGRSRSVADFLLPAGVHCHGFTIRHWKRVDTEVVLHAVDLLSV